MPEVLLANLTDLDAFSSAAALPPGGTTGFALVKTGSGDYAVGWAARMTSVNGMAGTVLLGAADIPFDPTDDIIGTDLQAALEEVGGHIGDLANPHVVTAAQVGLEEVDNTSNATERAAAATLTNKTIAAGSNTISGLTGAHLAANVLDTDVTLAANSDDRWPSQKAVKTLVAAVAAGIQIKLAVRVRATTGTLATDFDNGKTVDGVVVATGERFFWHAGGAAAIPNGVYIVAASGAPTRATDMDLGTEFTGAMIPVSEGTVSANTTWVCTTSGAITVGVTAVDFTLFPGALAYTANAPLTLSLGAFSAAIASEPQAQAGTASTVLLTPQRGAQQIAYRGVRSPLDYAGVGDNVADDTTPVEDAVAVVDYALWLPEGRTFYLPTERPPMGLYGPGSVRFGDDEVYTQFQPVVLPEQSSVMWNPTDTHAYDWLGYSFPDVDGYANVVVSIGCAIPILPDPYYRRSSVLGALVLQEAESIDRVEAIGQGTMRGARFGERITAVGSLALLWNAQLLSWLEGHNYDGFYPIHWSNPAWNWDNLETYRPGIRAILNALDDSDCAANPQESMHLVALGRDSLGLHLKGNDDVALGYRALGNAIFAEETVAVGTSAGAHGVFSNEAVYIGQAAGYGWVDKSRIILIGHEAGVDVTPADDVLVIQNDRDNTPLIYALLDDCRMVIGGDASNMAAHLHVVSQVSTAADEILRLSQVTGGVSMSAFTRGSGSYAPNAASSILKLAAMGTTSRSISATGTIAANGADYAEYRRVIEPLWGKVPAGALLGMNASGVLTDKWSDIKGRIYIKSTYPNLVGNDNWGQPEAIEAKYGVKAPGPKPVAPKPPKEVVDKLDKSMRQRPEHEHERIQRENNARIKAEVQKLRGKGKIFDRLYAEYEVLAATHELELVTWQAEVDAFEAAYQQERRQWDRMSMCGQVPVNLEGYTKDDIGKYLVPVQASTDDIGVQAIAQDDLTFDQYKKAFAVIEEIGPDGRPLVSVKIS